MVYSKDWSFFISPFSATLKRRDLIDSYYKQTLPGIKNYNEFANNPTDTADEGYPSNIIIGQNNPSGVIYHLSSRILKIDILINPKSSVTQTGNSTEIVNPFYCYNVKYYAEIAVICNQTSSYSVVVNLFREWIASDPVVDSIEGLIPSQVMINGGMIGSSDVYSCDPLFAKGTATGSQNFPYGFHYAQDSGKGKFAYYKITYINQFGVSSVSSDIYAYTPFNFNMDWYITE